MTRFAAVVVAILAVIFGPAIIATAIGRPLIMDCQNMTTATCEGALTYWRAEFEGEGTSGPVVAFWLKSTFGGTCGDVDIMYWGPPWGASADPLC